MKHFSGKVDGVKMHDHALTPEEITESHYARTLLEMQPELYTSSGGTFERVGVAWQAEDGSWQCWPADLPLFRKVGS